MLLQKEVPLGNPDVLVCSVGTEIFFEAAGTSPEANKDWAAELDQGWDRAKAIETAGKFSELSPQASSSLPKTQQSYLFVIAALPSTLVRGVVTLNCCDHAMTN